MSNFSIKRVDNGSVLVLLEFSWHYLEFGLQIYLLFHLLTLTYAADIYYSPAMF